MDELVLRFSGESWVEIADVTGRRMAYRMGNAADVLRLRGLAPFDILLGNAPNVSIEYNGKPYTNIPISRTNVASFRLGGSGDEGVKKDESQKSDPAT
jgi:cytoskeleton protein RodZ